MVSVVIVTRRQYPISSSRWNWASSSDWRRSFGQKPPRPRTRIMDRLAGVRRALALCGVVGELVVGEDSSGYDVRSHGDSSAVDVRFYPTREACLFDSLLEHCLGGYNGVYRYRCGVQGAILYVQPTEIPRFFQSSSVRSIASRYCASESLGISPGQSLEEPPTAAYRATEVAPAGESKSPWRTDRAHA